MRLKFLSHYLSYSLETIIFRFINSTRLILKNLKYLIQNVCSYRKSVATLKLKNIHSQGFQDEIKLIIDSVRTFLSQLI